VENRRQLLRAGVQEDRIEMLGQCTFCEPGKFFSFRRDREEAGRMVSYIQILHTSPRAQTPDAPRAR